MDQVTPVGIDSPAKIVEETDAKADSVIHDPTITEEAPLTEVVADVSVDEPVAATPSETESSDNLKRKADSEVEVSAPDATQSVDAFEPVTRESVIASITLPEDFDVSSGLKIPFNLSAYPTTNLMHLVAGLKELLHGYFPTTTFYVGGMNDNEPFILVTGEGSDDAKAYMEDMFANPDTFAQSADYSQNVFLGLPTKKRSRFGAMDASAAADPIVQLPGSGYTAPQSQHGYSAPQDHGNSPATEVLMYIPEDKVGLIIGRRGDTINMLQTSTGARITIARTPNEHPQGRPTTISGPTAESIERCQGEVNRLLENAVSGGATPGQHGGASHGDRMMVPSSVVGIIIGRAGETIRSLQMKTGCTVRIQKDHDAAPGASDREITLVGEPHQQAHARQEIEGLVRMANNNDGRGDSGMGGGYAGNSQKSIVMQVANNFVGLIIGRGGETIKNIMAQTGARIQIDKDQSEPTRTVTVTAPTENQAQHAQQMIDAVIQQQDNGGNGGYGQHQQHQHQQPGGYQQQQQQYGGYQQHQQQPQHGGYGQQQQYGGYNQQQRPPQQQQQQYGGYQQQQPQQAVAASMDPQRAAKKQSFVDHYLAQGYTPADAEKFAEYYISLPPA